MKVLLTVVRLAVLSWAGFHLARALGTIDPPGVFEPHRRDPPQP